METLRLRLEELCFLKKETSLLIKLTKKPSKSLVYRIIEMIFDYKTTILKGITYPKIDGLRMINHHFYNGETWHLPLSTVVVGDIHQDSVVYVYQTLYVHGSVAGRIHLMNENSMIYADHFVNAHLHFHHGVERLVNGESEIWNQEEGGNKSWRELSLLPVEKVE